MQTNRSDQINLAGMLPAKFEEKIDQLQLRDDIHCETIFIAKH